MTMKFVYFWRSVFHFLEICSVLLNRLSQVFAYIPVNAKKCRKQFELGKTKASIQTNSLFDIFDSSPKHFCLSGQKIDCFIFLRKK
jgi:hypothetical protein